MCVCVAVCLRVFVCACVFFACVTIFALSNEPLGETRGVVAFLMQRSSETHTLRPQQEVNMSHGENVTLPHATYSCVYRVPGRSWECFASRAQNS